MTPERKKQIRESLKNYQKRVDEGRWMESDHGARELLTEVDRLTKALENVRDEQVMSGRPLAPVKKYENALTESLRNIAIEALEGRTSAALPLEQAVALGKAKFALKEVSEQDTGTGDYLEQICKEALNGLEAAFK